MKLTQFVIECFKRNISLIEVQSLLTLSIVHSLESHVGKINRLIDLLSSSVEQTIGGE